MKRYFGFTLAETLVTLVIVGVVAALTIPTVVVKYQKKQTVVKLKKTYSELSQTTTKAIADYGPITTWDSFRNNNADDTKKFLNKYVIPYLKVTEKPTTQSEGKWEAPPYFNLNGTPRSSFPYGNFVRFTLPDGTIIYTRSAVWPGSNRDIAFYIDLNGNKKPNKLGRDLFVLGYYFNFTDSIMRSAYNSTLSASYVNGKLIPHGFWYSTRNQLLNGCNSNSEGVNCLDLIMRDGWEIKDDYPW